MALVSAGHTATTDWQTIYTVPAGQTARVTQIQAAGIVANGVAAAQLDLRWQDTSASASYLLIAGLTVHRGTAQGCLAGEMALDAGDSVQAKASTADAITLTLSAELI